MTVGGRCQRRSRDAANDENLALSTLVPGGFVPDQSRRATIGGPVTDLMRLGFDMVRRLSENTTDRSGCRLDGFTETSDQEWVGTAR